MTPDLIRNLRLGIEPITDRTCLLVESALEWIDNNTTIKIDIENLSAKARLFIAKYVEIMSLRTGVASESIGGLSQSFVTDTNDMIINLAGDLFGDDLITNKVKFVGAGDRWQ